MKIDFKDIVKLQRLYIEIFEEEDGYPVDYRVVRNKEKAQQRILDKITDDAILQNKIIRLLLVVVGIRKIVHTNQYVII